MYIDLSVYGSGMFTSQHMYTLTNTVHQFYLYFMRALHISLFLRFKLYVLPGISNFLYFAFLSRCLLPGMRSILKMLCLNKQ